MQENFIALALRQAVSALGHLHFHGVCHLEVSADDFYFAKASQRLPQLTEVCLKLMDTGAAMTIKDLATLSKQAMHATYYSQGKAPEQVVAEKNFTECASDACDIWALA